MPIAVFGARCVLTVCLALCLCGAAKTDDELEYDIDIPPLTVDAALNTLAQQTSIQLLFPFDLVKALDANPVVGRYTLMEALELLLRDTGLSGGLTESGVMTITHSSDKKSAAQEEAMMTGIENKTPAKRKGLLGVLAAVFSVGAGAEEAADEDGDEPEQVLEEIVVTGTNIRGVAPDSSPSFVFDKDDIAKTGFGTVQEFVDSLPQNFGGGANSETVGGGVGDRAAARNNVSGVSVNLRGVGSGNTLVLLNGSRVAPSGSLGAFVDISMIPLSAVERVEVLTDGASAIYGADAIAGVVNFVLRDDYDGAETFVRFGAVTDGNLNEYRAGQTLGKKWDSGNAMASYEFYHRDNLGAEDRSFAFASPLPTDLLPEQESHSVLLTASQLLSDQVTLRGHGAYSQRDGIKKVNLAGTNPITRNSVSKQYGGTAGADVKLWGDWLLDISGSYNKQTDFYGQDGRSPAQQKSESDLWSIDGKVDGSVFSLSGGEVKLAVGFNYREETFLHRIVASVFGNEGVSAEDNRRVSSAFGEVFIPFVGADNRWPGAERLELTLAGRYDNYSDFGSTFNPKVGLLWSPTDGLNFRGTYSTSFKPPNLADTGDKGGFVGVSIVPNPASITMESLAILDFSPNPGLGPETSTAWTVGIDYGRDVGQGGIDVSLTWFDIRYKDRIDFGGNTAGFLIDPAVFADLIVADPDPVVTAALIAQALRFVDFTGGGVWTMPGDEEFILDGRLLNLARVDTSGLDVNLAYSVETGIGHLNFGLNSSYLFNQERQITSAAPSFDVVNTLFNPVDFRLRGSVSWSRSGWNASTFVNYVGSYVDDRDFSGTGDVPISSWTTVDLNLSYDTGEGPDGNLFDNIKLSFSVLNLFNQDPPTIEPEVRFSRTDSFDPTNANALGQFISFQITKDW